MRAVRRSVQGSICGLLLSAAVWAAPPPSEPAPKYLRLEPGTWVLGGIDDLVEGDKDLVLMPRTCRDLVGVVEVSIGFVLDGDLTELEISGAFVASSPFELGVWVRNRLSGKCELVELLEELQSSFRLREVTLDSHRHRDPVTLEVELCLRIRRSCGPVPTDKDAVSVQSLSIEPPK